MKVNLFSDVFSEQCKTIANDSTLTRSVISRLHQEFFFSFDSFNDEITRIIWFLDPNEAYRYDEISICILKFCVIVVLTL